MRLDRWAKTGVLERVVVELRCDLLAALELDALSLDSTTIKLRCACHGCTSGKRGAKRSDSCVACPWLEQRAS